MSSTQENAHSAPIFSYFDFSHAQIFPGIFSIWMFQNRISGKQCHEHSWMPRLHIFKVSRRNYSSSLAYFQWLSWIHIHITPGTKKSPQIFAKAANAHVMFTYFYFTTVYVYLFFIATFQRGKGRDIIIWKQRYSQMAWWIVPLL